MRQLMRPRRSISIRYSLVFVMRTSSSLTIRRRILIFSSRGPVGRDGSAPSRFGLSLPSPHCLPPSFVRKLAKVKSRAVKL